MALYMVRRKRKICRHFEKFSPAELTRNLMWVAMSTARMAGATGWVGWVWSSGAAPEDMATGIGSEKFPRFVESGN
jgi:hypothetical protein